MSSRADMWNVTPAERSAGYPCDALTSGPSTVLMRGVDVGAPAEVVFRWLCQLKAAPYSYDWVDRLGRRSPRTLTPGLDQLERGQRFLVFEITDFQPGRHITGRAVPRARALFGVLAVTYQVTPDRPDTSRLVVRLLTEVPSSAWRRVRREALAWGDLVMMRRQLLTLAELAEAQWRRAGSRAAGSRDGSPTPAPGAGRPASAAEPGVDATRRRRRGR